MPRRIEKLREADPNELHAQQKELTDQIFRLRFQLSTGQAEALKRLREAKKNLARIKTLQRQDAKDDCGRSDAARAAYEVPPRGAHLEKILRARRTARSAPGRHGAHHRLSAAFAAQALAARGSADTQGGRRVSEGRGADR